MQTRGHSHLWVAVSGRCLGGQASAMCGAACTAETGHKWGNGSALHKSMVDKFLDLASLMKVAMVATSSVKSSSGMLATFSFVSMPM